MHSAFALLLPFLQREWTADRPTPNLLVADENLYGVDFSGLDNTTKVISNRFDIARMTSSAGLDTQFNDFDFSAYPPNYFTRICYRISKEKAVVEHIIDQASQVLSDNGELILCGAKDEGIKRFANVAGKRFASSANTRKHGPLYLARIIKPAQASRNERPTRNLETASDYCKLIPVKIDDNITLYTKAGAFGSAKIDQGSAMLTAYLETFFNRFRTHPRNLLDLGCGYGYLTVCAARFGIERLVASDNCAAAINTCQTNLMRSNIPAELIADDCAHGIDEKFDAILCNPPFHQGFNTDSTLTEKFVRSAAQHLSPKGKALFVVNQFVAIEKVAARMFAEVEEVQRDRSFKLITMAGAQLKTS